MANKRKPTWRKMVGFLSNREDTSVKRTTLYNKFTDVKPETVDRYVRHLKMAEYLTKKDKNRYNVYYAPKKYLTISDVINEGRNVYLSWW